MEEFETYKTVMEGDSDMVSSEETASTLSVSTEINTEMDDDNEEEF